LEADREELTIAGEKSRWASFLTAVSPFSWFKPKLADPADERRTDSPPSRKFRSDWEVRREEKAVTAASGSPAAMAPTGVSEPRPAARRELPPVHTAPIMLKAGSVADAKHVPWGLPAASGQPGVVADQARVGDLDVRAASVVGSAHRRERPATTRQDAYRLGRDRADQHLLIAVADGVSAASRSDLGANVAVRAAVDQLREELDAGAGPGELDFEKVFRAASKHVVGAAKQTGVDPQELLTALIVAVVPARGGNAHGDRLVRIASVGDVSAWVHEGATWQQVAGDVKTGLDLNQLDSFLPHLWNCFVATVVELRGDSALALMTDGVGDVLTGLGGAAGFFARRWRRPPSLTTFLGDVDCEAAGEVDDRTAVVAWPVSHVGTAS
jgi:hypothetical protein